MATSDLQMSGLVTGFDWKTFVDSLMSVEHVPADRLAAEKTLNNSKVTALANLGTRMTALQGSIASLSAGSAFQLRTAASATASSSWSAGAGANTGIGSYKIAVTQLATAARQTGGTDIGSRLSATSDVSATTLANLPVGNAITAGTFTVNGKQVTVALTDSLDTVFTAIAAATAGTANPVTAAYNPATDKVTLSAASPIVLGAANDSSNFLRSLKMVNNGTNGISSAGALGSVKTGATLANANFQTPITAVDADGKGTFSINGTSMSYNINTDTVAGIMAQINQSAAGVTASYDPTNDRVTLTNNTTGDVGVGVDEAAGGLLGALGLSTGSTLVRGKNALFSLNDGAELTSASNTLDETTLGTPGLSVTVNSASTETIQVSADNKSMRAKIEDFIAKFNDVQEYLETATKTSTDSKGKVTTAVLTDNREIQEWGRSLRSMAFAAVGGLPGSISRLENLGIDFKSGTNSLEIKNSAKLDAALRDKPGDVDMFYNSATTGFGAKFTAFLTSAGAQNTTKQANLNKSNTGLDGQIADIERRLVQQRAIMESAFIAMESAQQLLKTQQTALTSAFSSTAAAK